VLFRYLPLRGDAGPVVADRVNAALRRRLLEQGSAVVGRTELGSGPGSVRLKLTLLNPHTTTADLDRLIALVLAAGTEAEDAIEQPETNT
jgi:L-2,4-diaminobutyrate decarboxylase